MVLVLLFAMIRMKRLLWEIQAKIALEMRTLVS